MKTTNKKYIWLLVTIFLISCGQDTSLQERIFIKKLNNKLEWPEDGLYSDELMNSVFDMITRNPSSLDYNFNEDIRHIKITTSDDGNIRAYNLERYGFEGNPSWGFSCRTLLQYRSGEFVFYLEDINFNGYITHIHNIDSNTFYLLNDWQGSMNQGTYEQNTLYVYKIDNNKLHKIQRAFANKDNVSNHLEFSWEDFGGFVEIDYDKEDSLVVYNILKKELYVIKGAPLKNRALKYRQYYWNGRRFELREYDKAIEYYNDKFFIRIEQNSENSWTYKCWNGGTTHGEPNLVITSGIKQYWNSNNKLVSYDEWVTDDESSPSGVKYTFSNNGYRYEYNHGWNNERQLEELYIFDPDEKIIYYGEFTPILHP